MPCAVNAFNVKIASLGEAAMESIIAREVIWAWNERHALERKQILLPQNREDSDKSRASDLLVAFFCSASSTPAMTARRNTGDEIEQYLQAGTPVLIYFSEARVDLEAVSAEQEEELFLLGKKYGSRAKIDAYGNDKEFRAKFTRDLEATIGEHAHFRIDDPAAKSVQAVAPPVAAPPPEQKLSERAVTLLSEACEDFEAYIGRNKIGSTLKIQANGKQLVNHADPDDGAKWDSAVQELISGGYIHDAGYNGQLFQITSKGFAFLKSIGKTPIGYIAEMGGM